MELISKKTIELSLKDAIGNKSRESWRIKILGTIAGILHDDPVRYRGFGLYWWNLKKALLTAGYEEYGLELDNDIADQVDYQSKDLNIAAAVLYESWRLDQGLQSNPNHTIVEGDESGDYTLIDQDMEIVIKYKSFPRIKPYTGSTGTIEESAKTVKKNRKDSKSSKTIQKKTKKVFKLQGEYSFQGMNIAVENKRGSTRSGKDPDGATWSIKMKYDYGYIRSTKATDGECVDCYINKIGRKSQKIFVIHQHKIEEVKKWKNGICPKCGNSHEDCIHAYDEDKVMLGFSSKKAAIKAYLKQYDSRLFLGPVSTYSRKEFKKALENSFGKRLPLTIEESINLWLEIRTASSFCDLKTAVEGIF